jgi:glycosyltransferase involved in cell wall biosynthesis/2-polyprenyl-3-methyl-5-hydroxy-6-metoxy-1,4-benzoquinol methylase
VLGAAYEGTDADGTADAIDEGRRPLFLSLLRELPPWGGRRCLDVGSGGGLFVRLAAAAGWEAMGVDPAGPEQSGSRFRLVRMEFPSVTPLPSPPFALVTFLGSFTYMRDPVAALRAAHAVLEPGGMVLVRVPNVGVHLAVLRAADTLGTHIGAWLRRGTILHARSFSPRALEVAFARAGFSGARVGASPPVPGDPYGSGARAIGAVKMVVGAATRGVAVASGRRLVWSPSLEGRAVRTAARPRVLHVITRLTLGGSSESSIAQIEALQAAGYACALATGFAESDRDVLARASARGCRLIDVPTLGREASPMRDLRALVRLIRVMRRERPAIVHTHTSKAGFVGRLAARLAHVPAVVHQPHGHIFYGYYGAARTRIYMALERLAARWADRLVVLTERGADEHLARGIGHLRQFATVPSGVPIRQLRAQALRRDEARAALGLSPSAFVIAALGRLVPIKGFDLLVEALPDVVAALPATHALIIGDGPLRGALEGRAAALGMTSHLTVTGVRSDVAAVLAAADVLVAPSRNEGMGRALVEAMALGLPVVATAVGGIPAVVVDGECGRLIPPENPAALARALIDLGLDPAARRRLGDAACRRAEQFSTEQATGRLLAVYAELHA